MISKYCISVAKFFAFTIICSIFLVTFSCKPEEKKVLVFSKTDGFRHGSIEAGAAAIQKLGRENGFQVTTTEDSKYFVEDSLSQYQAVVFLNTTRNVLNAPQQADFERYIQAGGGFVGIHAATDTEYDWPWYNKLVGAVFEGHPRIQEATLAVDTSHPSTQHLAPKWVRSDEWYNFVNLNPDIHVLITIDESSYEGGTNGDGHPISWYHEYDGGRSFYTEMGHTDETFEDPKFLQHLLGGIVYAMGNQPLDYSKARVDRVPPEDRFVKNVLDFNLNEPMELEEIPGQGILFIERRGAVKFHDFNTEKTETIAQIDLFYGNEDGLLGITVDPNYEENNWVYFLYTAPGEESKQRISRFTFKDKTLDFDSEKILLEVPTDRHCCHSGGALEFGPDGNLFIALGDNTNPFASSGFSPMDEREGRQLFDAQRTTANTNTLRGKILRIRPEEDGTYSIPAGNLFPEGTPNTRPEIYVMGVRNPFRPSIDSKTGYLYWGDVGPDAGKAKPDRGPSGMGEYNQARQAGNWGWPYTRGYNEAYNDFDFETETSGEKFDPENLINDSPNNTGLKELPPAQASMIPMTYYRSEEFPWMGTGGINPMAGPIFHKENYPNASNTFPAYFEDKLFVYEWMRDWIYVITLDKDQNYVKADPFMPNTEFSHPMDMIFASNGKLYVLEYGQKWNTQNLDARLSSISYIAGNRNPVAQITQDKVVGGVPLTVSFSAEKSLDYDGDALTYAWSFTDATIQSTEISPSHTFTKEGAYTIKLEVTDAQGNTAITTSKVMVGNDSPEVSITVTPADSLYWDGKTVNYQVSVTDAQDGDTASGKIQPEEVTVSFEYIPEGKDLVKAAIGHQRNTVEEGLNAIKNSDCKACHAAREEVNGPSYLEIAKKYEKDDTGYLVSKIIKGGSGVWGERAMAAHPQLDVDEVSLMVEYILSLKPKPKSDNQNLPLKGTLTFDEHTKSDGEGIYVLMATYRDKGHPALAESNLTDRDQVIFHPQKLQAEKANGMTDGLGKWSTSYSRVVGPLINDNYLRFDKVALKDLEQITLAVFYNGNTKFKGTVEVRENALDGPLIGSTVLGHFGKEKTGYHSIPIKTNSTEANLFLVFKNPDSPNDNIGHSDYISLQYKR